MNSKLKILYIWEEGHDLGHISIILPIARRLAKKGHQVKILYPATMGLFKNKDFDEIINSNEFEYYPCPIVRYRQNRTMVSQLDKLEFIDSLSSDQMANWIFNLWFGILNDEKPDIVLCDYSTLGLMCSNLYGVPTVIVDGGFYYPEYQGKEYIFDRIIKNESVLVDASLGISSKKRGQLLTRVNSALLKYGTSPKENLQDFFQCDKFLAVNYKELMAIPKSDTCEYIGYIRNENTGLAPIWPSDNTNLPKVFMYLKQDTPNLAKILDLHQRQNSRNTICYIPNCEQKIIDRFNSNFFKVVSSALNIHQVLSEAGYVVSNAGAGLCAHSALYGRPMLLIPLQSEADLNTAALVRSGIAIKLKTESEAYFEVQIRELIRNPDYAENAKNFANQNKFANVDEISEKILSTASSARNNDRSSIQVDKIKRLDRKINFCDLDVIFLSYDEPIADENWFDLKKKAPWAQRVHGVKGFDAAHKAAAQLARTERFILVDGDNVVDKEFFEIKANVPAYLEHSVWQWQSRNAINNLVYPFGGIKIWTKEIALNMQTHEAVTSENATGLGTDFWDQSAYTCFKPVFSTTHPNGSPYQAFRAGFREGVKLTVFVSPNRDIKILEKMRRDAQVRNLLFWMSVGVHSKNGYWALYGSRLGMLLCLDKSFDIKVINDYDWFQNFWKKEYEKLTLPSDIISNANGIQSGYIESLLLIEALEKQYIKIVEMAPKLGLLNMNKSESEIFSNAVHEHELKKNFQLFDMFV